MIDVQNERKICCYAGSFAPFHLGHLNIANKARKIFDEVIIAQGINKEKKLEGYCFQSLAALESLRNFRIFNYSGLLADALKQFDYPTLIRGLRSVTDVPEEMAFLRYVQDMVPEIKVIHIFCDAEYEHLSSHAIRNLIQYGKGNQYIVK